MSHENMCNALSSSAALQDVAACDFSQGRACQHIVYRPIVYEISTNDSTPFKHLAK